MTNRPKLTIEEMVNRSNDQANEQELEQMALTIPIFREYGGAEMLIVSLVLSGYFKKEDGWSYFDPKELSQFPDLSVATQYRAFKRLSMANFIEIRNVGRPAVRKVRVNKSKLLKFALKHEVLPPMETTPKDATQKELCNG